jgi:WS/DGAT/MGAT family acyltransferase
LQQLSGIDASFLAMETATTFTHVSSLSVFDPGEASGTDWFEAAKRTIAARLDRAPLFRRRLVEVPFGLDLPYWVDDPAFDLDFHVRHHAVPPPGDDRQLADTVARIVGRPLDRSRPLWELYVIEGLSGGRMAWLTKVHHATIDGASGAELLATLLDTDPHTRPPETAVVPPADGELPDDATLLRRTAAEYLRRPEKMVRLTVRTLRELAQRTGSGSVAALADLAAQPVPGPVGDLVRRRLRASRGVDVDRPPALPPTMAPRTPFNATVTAHRRFAFTTVALDDAKRIRRAFGCTLNDVVLAACSGTLRRWLAEHDALPDEPSRSSPCAR